MTFISESKYIDRRTSDAMDFPLHFSDQLREHLRALRKARGLTQADLGRLLGVGQARIAEIEANPGVVGLDQLMKLLSALDASLLLRDNTATHGEVAPAPPQVTEKPTPRAASPGTHVAEPPPRRSFTISPKKGSW
jgi:HTH-type transcriptional regulator/antitoxin HipB